MPDNKNQGVEAPKHNESPKKRSFFGGEINEKTKDLLDFRYNTQEEIDKLNEEMTTTSDLDEMIRQSNNNEDVHNQSEEYLKQKDEKEAESDLEKDLQSFNESLDNNGINDNYNEIYGDESKKPIEGEIVENPDEDEQNNVENKAEPDKEDNIEEPKDKVELEETSEISDQENKQESNQEPELGDSTKLFDPFEINLDEENSEGDEENLNPFELNEEQDDEETSEEDNKKQTNNIEEIEEESKTDNEEKEDYNERKLDDEEDDDWNIDDDDNENVEKNEGDTKEIVEEASEEQNNNIEEKEEDDDWSIDDDDNEDVEEIEDIAEEDSEENEEETIEEGIIEEDNKEDIEEKEEEGIINAEKDEEIDEDQTTINTPIAVNPNEKDEKQETLKNRKVKKNSSTGEIVTEEEIQLEQGQDTPDSEDDEEYQPIAEELFEYEPEFFADDELSQQFLHLVQNVREIFKLERKDGEQNAYFKILGGKTTDSTLEYLFYLIEQENEPIDLYIKKVETRDDEENEHMVQFSYNNDQELNIFVDEVILYEKINKADADTPEYNDTKAILEKFIFLTDNYYDKLKEEIDKQREEKQKKRQLQQIFKGF